MYYIQCQVYVYAYVLFESPKTILKLDLLYPILYMLCEV